MTQRRTQLAVEDLTPKAGIAGYYQQQINFCKQWKSRSGPFAAELAVARLIDRKLDLLNNKLKLEKLFEL